MAEFKERLSSCSVGPPCLASVFKSKVPPILPQRIGLRSACRLRPPARCSNTPTTSATLRDDFTGWLCSSDYEAKRLNLLFHSDGVFYRCAEGKLPDFQLPTGGIVFHPMDGPGRLAGAVDIGAQRPWLRHYSTDGV